MHQLSQINSNRFAWLPPLSNQESAKGPWVIVDNKTDRYLEDKQNQYRKISIGSLLRLAAGVINIPNAAASNTTQATWNSECRRFRVEWKKQTSDTLRLFVQDKDDYYTQIELFIDDASVATFNEPVWPHLQRAPLTSTERLIFPSDYLDALEASATSSLKQPSFINNQ